MSRLAPCSTFNQIVFWLLASTTASAAPLYDWEDPNSQAIIEEISKAGIAKDEEKQKEIKCPPRLTPYKPNHVVYQWAKDDELAFRVHYSFKYRLYPLNNPDICSSSISGFNSQAYFSYTGVFDFYAGTRYSGPVINRISNPAFHYRYANAEELEKRIPFLSLKWIDFGLEHRSDGQVNEPLDLAVQAAAQQAFDANDHKYFDSISQGSNYVSAEAHFNPIGNWSTYASIKAYISQNSQVTWGPLKNSNVSISNYDILNIVARKAIGNGELSLEYIIGSGGFRKSSGNIDYLFSRETAFPMYVRVHFGPFQTLSNYTVSKPSIGIGVKLIP
ncbi:MAG: hypothetical protein ABII81_06105 [Pseudomonadota bacterium]